MACTQRSTDSGNRPRPQPLRKLRSVRQADIAKQMGISQSAVSQIEHRPAIDEKTLHQYVEACGSTLELVARRPDGHLAPLRVTIR